MQLIGSTRPKFDIWPKRRSNLVESGSSGMKSSSFGLGRSYTQKFCYKSLVPWFLYHSIATYIGIFYFD